MIIDGSDNHLNDSGLHILPSLNDAMNIHCLVSFQLLILTCISFLVFFNGTKFVLSCKIYDAMRYLLC